MGAIGMGGRIRQRREEMGLTQDQLAEKVGVGRDAVIRWEKGRRGPHRHLSGLAAALDTTVEALAGKTPLREAHAEAYWRGVRDAVAEMKRLADQVAVQKEGRMQVSAALVEASREGPGAIDEVKHPPEKPLGGGGVRGRGKHDRSVHEQPPD